MAKDEKVREVRLRNTAKRRGFDLSKSRRRDTLALDYGKWRVLSAQGKVLAEYDDLDGVEDFLESPES